MQFSQIKYLLEDLIYNKSTLDQVLAWCWLAQILIQFYNVIRHPTSSHLQKFNSGHFNHHIITGPNYNSMCPESWQWLAASQSIQIFFSFVTFRWFFGNTNPICTLNVQHGTGWQALTLWGWVRHIYVNKLTTFGSDNGLVPTILSEPMLEYH